MSFTRRRRPQLSLATLLCVITVIAVWLALVRVRGEIAQLESTLPALRDFARELRVVDPDQFALAQQWPKWYGDQIYRLYVPPGGRYELCLAREEIDKGHQPTDDTDGVTAAQRVPIAAGEHMLEIREQDRDGQNVVEIRLGDQTVITDQRPADWLPSRSSSWSTSDPQSQQHDAGKPLLLYRKRYHEPSTNGSSRVSDDSGKGVLVWIEPLEL